MLFHIQTVHRLCSSYCIDHFRLISLIVAYLIPCKWSIGQLFVALFRKINNFNFKTRKMRYSGIQCACALDVCQTKVGYKFCTKAPTISCSSSFVPLTCSFCKCDQLCGLEMIKFGNFFFVTKHMNKNQKIIKNGLYIYWMTCVLFEYGRALKITHVY